MGLGLVAVVVEGPVAPVLGLRLLVLESLAAVMGRILISEALEVVAALD